MSTLLRRELAPIQGDAWKMIDEEAARILKGNLTARALVDFSGPHGLEKAAINLGSLGKPGTEVVKGVSWRLRRVLPLVEQRVDFTLSLADLDQVARGGETPDLEPVANAAEKAANFEERALYLGLPEAGHEGMVSASTHKKVALEAAPGGYPKSVESAVHALQSGGIAGPYHLVLGRAAYRALAVGDNHGYPLHKRIRDLLEGGEIRWSPAVEGGMLFSGRGGDYELVVGQDYAIGFAGCEGNTVKLFLLSSFAFRVLEPAAAVVLTQKSS